MSEWTYVRGCLSLGSSPFEVKKDFTDVEPKRADFKTEKAYKEAAAKHSKAFHEAIYLPYPEEQFKLGSPIIRQRDKKSVISFDGTCIYSLPRAKPIIEEAFKLFPQGELGFRYSLDQIADDARSSISGFIHPCLYEYYHKAIDKMYASFHSDWKSFWNFEQLNKYIGVEEDCGYDTAAAILCGINTSLRGATADEVYHSLLQFLDYLKEHEISIDNGYLEWYDSFSSYYGYRYAFRTGSWLGEWTIMKLDLKTNEILWKHSHLRAKEEGSNKTDFSKFVEKVETIKEIKREEN